MRFALGLSAAYAKDAPAVPQFEERLEQVRAARDNGFDSIWMGEHYLSEQDPWFQNLVSLARFSVEAGDMGLGAVILLPLHHPIELAEQIATLDIICQGRFMFVAGMGWREAEFEAFGVPRPARVSRFVESLTLMKKLWTEDNLTFEGQHFRLSGVTMTNRPIQKPHPPIWIGASAEPAVRRAAQMGHTWVMSSHPPLATLERLMEVYRQCLAELNRPFPHDVAIFRQLYVAEDLPTALQEGMPYLEAYYRFFGEHYARVGQPQELAARLEEHAIIGGPDECLEQIKRCQERLGARYFVFRVGWPGMEQYKVLKAIRLLGAKVRPRC